MPNHHPPETPPGNRQPSVSKFAQRAEDVAERAHTGAVERVQQARQKAEASLQERRGQTADRIQRVGDALRSAANQLENEDDEVARYVNQASDVIEDIASYVASADVREIVSDAENFARRRPALFYGGALLLGVVAGRFLKSTGSEAWKEMSEGEGERIAASDAPSDELTQTGPEAGQRRIS